MEYMNLALDLAKKGVGLTSPNPAVAALIVKNNKVLAEGWHKKAGSDHAEIDAIKNVQNKDDLVGATVYVTLEPCGHMGKTGPCAEALVKAGVSKVVIAMKDPNPEVNGKGINFLKKNGVEVELMDQDDEVVRKIREINQPFLKGLRSPLPYVILKSAVSANWKISAKKGERTMITCDEALEDAKIERSKCDAVLVGYGTVLADDPELGLDDKFAGKNFFRVILGEDIKVDQSKRVFRDGSYMIFDWKPGDDLGIVLRELKKQGINSVFVEGGSAINTAFYKQDLVDKLLLYISDKEILGDQAVPYLRGDCELPDLSSFETDKVGMDKKASKLIRFY